MSKVMVTITAPGAPPRIDEIRSRYGLTSDEIDSGFGVIETDPEAHLYTILVDSGAASRITGDSQWKVEGPFSNPRIEPFGPPE